MESSSRLTGSQRRAQILDIAVEHFATAGYQRTSMESIAAAAGITKPIVYQHFSSKDELYLEVVRTMADRMASEISVLADFEGGTAEMVRTGLERYAEILETTANPMRLLEIDTTMQAEVIAAVRAIRDESAGAVAAAMLSSTGLPQRHAVILGRAIAFVAHSASTELAIDGSEEEKAQVIELITTLITRGVLGIPDVEEASARRQRSHAGSTVRD